MIRASLAAFINASEVAAAYGLKAFVMTPDLVLSEVPVPRAIVTYLTENGQELWVLGDSQRKENAVLQVTFSLKRPQDVRDVRARFRRLIESATTLDVGGVTHPGIDFIPTADLLRDSGDQKTYFSDQPGWFASPVPIIYKEDPSGNPVVVVGGYSVNYAAGSITFAVANSPTDRIRATYKAGIIDFNIAGVAETQIVDQENNPSKYNVIFDLLTWFNIKSNASRYL